MKKTLMLAIMTASILVSVNLSSIIGDQVSASESASKPFQRGEAGFDELIKVPQVKRNAPSLNLGNSYELPSVLTGAVLEKLVGLNAAALATGDYDEDGVPDLLAGYAGNSGGVITLHRGNVDATYPNSFEAQQRRARSEFTSSAFLPLAYALEIEERADFLGAGDFDADSHWDVVAASRGGNALYFLRGDGRGRFGPSERIDLPGRVTALVAGEINRPDGLADVVVTIAGPAGPKVLVFEGPEGALRTTPETFPLPAPAETLALGHLDTDRTVDLAVGAGSELLIVAGRDRKLSLDQLHQAEVPRPVFSHRPLPSAIVSMAVGDFGGDTPYNVAALLRDGSIFLVNKGQAVEKWENESPNTDNRPPANVLVCARLSGLAKDDLVLADRVGRKLRVLTIADDQRKSEHTRAQSIAQEASSVELDLEAEPVALLPMRLNPTALCDLVVLRRGHSSPTIVPAAKTATLIVNSAADDDDGACEGSPGDCTLREAINAANASAVADTINFQIGTGVRTISVTGSGLPIISNSGGPLTIDGTTQPGFVGTPIIELNGSGAGAFGNGITIDAAGCTVRGLAINRFNGNGILLFNGQNGVIEGNFIGTDITGTMDLGNNAHGVALLTPISGLTIGGTTVQARNLISGNTTTGIFLNSSSGILVQGNFIGTDITGTVALGNGFLSFAAVTLASTNNSVVGGMTAGAGNVISGNNNRAVQLDGSGNLVQGNVIGLDTTGANGLGNLDGAGVNGSSNTIGGTAATARNIIAGNNGDGINIGVGSLHLVQGNYIGSDVTGTLDRGNTGAGVRLTASNTVIGGTGVGARNVISGNGQAGVAIGGQDATGNQVQGNFIGLQGDGASPLGNGSSGVAVGEFSFTFANNNTIGGAAPGAGNRIAFNGGDGVFVSGGTGNAIRSNSIFSNTELGIDLGLDGVTPNDSCDADAGANNLQNFPVLTSAISTGGNTNIQGTLNSTANTTFTLEFFSNSACDSSGNGEGQNFIGSATVTTNASCNAVITATLPVSVSAGQFIIATATDSSGNTSEFSQCIQSTAGCAITCPPNQTVDTGPGSTQCSAVVNYPAPTTTGGCGTVTCAPTSGSSFPVGTTPVNCTTTSGPSCSFTVTISDTTLPTVVCPANITASAPSGQCSAVVNYTNPAANDNCGVASVSCSPPSGSTFVAGVTSVTCLAMDNNQNTASCGFTVTVNANLVITPSNRNHPASGGSGTVNVTAGGGCSWTASSNNSFITITSGASGTGNGTVNYSVAANSGSARSGTLSIAGQTFTVTQDAPVCTLTCQTIPAVNTQPGPTSCGAVVNYPAPATSGPCGQVNCAPASGSFFPVGVTTVTCTASGGASCSMPVTVVDNRPPSIACPADIVTTASANSGCSPVNYSGPAISDNCAGATVACSPPSGTCFPRGTTSVSCTATDATGNTSSCGFTVKVVAFDICLQDDTDSSLVLLINSATGDYLFCRGTISYGGTGTIKRKGGVYSLEHDTADRRVLAKADTVANKGTASLQSTPGTTIWTIRDTNLRNNSCVCGNGTLP